MNSMASKKKVTKKKVSTKKKTAKKVLKKKAVKRVVKKKAVAKKRVAKKKAPVKKKAARKTVKKKVVKKVVKRKAPAKRKTATKSIAKKPAKNYIRICPKCGSTSITKTTNEFMPSAPAEYSCNACHYKAHIFPEVEDDKLDYFKGHIVDNNKQKQRYGAFNAHVLWKVLGMVMIVVGIFMFLMLQNFKMPIIYPSLVLGVGCFLTWLGFLE